MNSLPYEDEAPREKYAHFEQARKRVEDTPELCLWYDEVMEGWSDDSHFEWVATAEISEIVDWASEIAALEEEDRRAHGDETITLGQAAELSGVAYSTLAQAAREGRIEARRSGPKTWLTTKLALKRAIKEGKLNPGTRGRPKKER